jgi:SAM-dependent methyltransferase
MGSTAPLDTKTAYIDLCRESHPQGNRGKITTRNIDTVINRFPKDAQHLFRGRITNVLNHHSYVLDMLETLHYPIRSRALIAAYSSPQTIIDLGCGKGIASYDLGECEIPCVAVDLVPPPFPFPRDFHRQEERQLAWSYVEPRQGNALTLSQDLPDLKGKVTFGFSCASAQYWGNVLQAIREIFWLLDVGGLFLIDISTKYFGSHNHFFPRDRLSPVYWLDDALVVQRNNSTQTLAGFNYLTYVPLPRSLTNSNPEESFFTAWGSKYYASPLFFHSTPCGICDKKNEPTSEEERVNFYRTIFE